jgi:hypothetical protein
VKKSWILLAGAALGLSSCVVTGNVEVFSAFNLNAAKIACVASANSSVKELNLTFNYTGTLRGLNMTFTPYQKPAQTVTVSDIDAAPPAGFRIVTSTAGTAKLFLDLQQLNPTPAPVLSTQAIVQPNPQTIYPMDIQIEALGKTADAKIKLNNLTNVDVADCYPPKPVP